MRSPHPVLPAFTACERIEDGFLLAGGHSSLQRSWPPLWHPPTLNAKAERMEHAEHRCLEPPAELPCPTRHEDVTVLGRTDYRRQQEPFGLRMDDRRRHVYITGKTGMGKSTLLASMILSDIAAGRGVGLIDPHGELSEQVIARLPARRTNDVVYFDAGDTEYPISFNPLAAHWPDQRQRVASAMLSVFKRQFGLEDGNAPRLLHILRNSVHALLETADTSLLHLQRLIQDDNFRRTVTGKLRDPIVRAFWLEEYARWNDRYRTEAIAAVQNKLCAFLTDPGPAKHHRRITMHDSSSTDHG